MRLIDNQMVVASSRTDKMMDLRAHGVYVIHLDLTDDASIDLYLATIRAAHGEIDVLVNKAGLRLLRRDRRSADGTDASPIRSQPVRTRSTTAKSHRTHACTTLGPHRQCLVHRLRRCDAIGGWYQATKFALEGYSASLRQELEPFGIDVVVIRPGAIATEWSGIADESLLATSGHGHYAQAAKPLSALFNSAQMTKLAAPPKVVADVILKAATARRPFLIRAFYTITDPLLPLLQTLFPWHITTT